VNNHNWMKKFLAVLGSSLIGLMLSTVTYAANPEPANVTVEFVAPLTIAKTGDLEFGLLDLNITSPEEVTIEPDNNVIDLAGRVVGGTQAAATFDTQGASGKLITILIMVPVPGANWTFGAWQCQYDISAFGDCGAGMTATTGPATKIVRVGVTLIANAGPLPAVSDPGTFSLSILYQ